MKVGSLVELVDDNWKVVFNEIIYPIKHVIYTVREIDLTDDSIYLAEILNKKYWCQDVYNVIVFTEPNFCIKKFRELQPPIANIEEHINENTLEYETPNPPHHNPR